MRFGKEPFSHERRAWNTTRHNTTEDKLHSLANRAARWRGQINRQQFNSGESSAWQKLDEPAGELSFLLALSSGIYMYDCHSTFFFSFSQQRKIAPTTGAAEGLIHSASPLSASQIAHSSSRKKLYTPALLF